MSYRVYIKHDYKPVVRWYPDRRWYLRKKSWLLLLTFASLATVYYLTELANRENLTQLTLPQQVPVAAADFLPSQPAIDATAIPAPQQQVDATTMQQQSPPPKPAINWQTVTVKPRENLSLIFDRLHVTPAVLYQVMSTGREAQALKNLLPGDKLQFQIEYGELQAIRYEQSLTSTLQITRTGDGFQSDIIVTELDKRVKEATGQIKDSLYQAALDAGLSDNLIMRFVGIYGWDIDFALDIRKGDNFKVIYEEQYKGNKKVGEGPILVSEFSNRGKIYRAVRYTASDGHTGYYNENGYSMRKAFLRTPLKFSYISSGFSLRRMHPILNRIRAHKGVDYAAPIGTPVKATGDGIVVMAGRNGGFGNMIELRHGGVYSTVYAHLSRFARGLKRGQHVNQGDVIGYVGMTGLATGPHLHYEFRVHGVHKNPLTVKLPKALKIPDQQMARFNEQARPLLATLSADKQTDIAAKDAHGSDNLVLALDDTDKADNPVR